MQEPRVPFYILNLMVLFIAACGPVSQRHGPSPIAPSERELIDREQVRESIPFDPVILPQMPAPEPCPDAPGLLCYTLSMPLQHAAPNGPSTPLRFALRPADDKESQEALVVLFGGPGDPGVYSLGPWLARIDPTIKEKMTIITMDLRGVAGSGAMDCDHAADAYSFTPPWAYEKEEIAALATAAAKAAADCVSELGRAPSDLVFYNTDEAAADLDALRARLGLEQWHIYSLSYGTQLAQTYVNRYPTRVKSLVLDGAVDLSADLLSYEEDLTLAQNKIFSDLDAACRGDADCRRAFSAGASPFTPPTRVYDQIFAALLEQAASLALPGSDGTLETWDISAYDLEYALSASMRSPERRARFLWALAEARYEKDFAPLFRIAYGRPEPLDPPSPPSSMAPQSSSGIFWTFICNDYGSPEGEDGAARFQGFVRSAQRLQKTGLRIHGPLFSEAPCAFWPGIKGSKPRPSLFRAPGIPTLVIGAAADANVPPRYAHSIAAQLDQGRLIQVSGSQHVSYSYHIQCVNRLVDQFWREQKLPAERELLCKDSFLGPWPHSGEGARHPLPQLQKAGSPLVSIERSSATLEPELPLFSRRRPAHILSREGFP